MNDSSDNMVLQSDKNVVIDEVLDDNDDCSGNDSNEDEDLHSHEDDDHHLHAKKAPGILRYICSLFVP